MFNDLKNELHKKQAIMLEREEFKNIVSEAGNDNLEDFVLGESGSLAMSEEEDDGSDAFKSDADIEKWADSFDKQMDEDDEDDEDTDAIEDQEVDEMFEDDDFDL